MLLLTSRCSLPLQSKLRYFLFIMNLGVFFCSNPSSPKVPLCSSSFSFQICKNFRLQRCVKACPMRSHGLVFSISSDLCLQCSLISDFTRAWSRMNDLFSFHSAIIFLYCLSLVIQFITLCNIFNLGTIAIRQAVNYNNLQQLSLNQPFSMSSYHHSTSSPLASHYRNSNPSPQKLSTSINLFSHSKSPHKTELSPRKPQSTLYTVHHEQKLKVFVKFKPPSLASQFLNVTYLNEKQVQIERQSTNNKIYHYDRVFHQSVGSQRVFTEGCVQVVDQLLTEAENGLIFVYGHTGTGKTFTMGLLDNVNRNSTGIVPETLRYIFKVKQKHEQSYPKSSRMQISLSFNEIYMDQVYDMLDFQNDHKLQIRENQSTKQPYIENNISILINNVQEAYQLLNIGLEKRRVGEQKINKRSSRGHGLITLTILLPSGKVSRLCFVDLAGSQRVKESESVGKTLKEAVHINTSLSALEALLMNIDEQSVRMYRGNKLTRLLQPFLESGKIRLFVTSNYENIQPLEFAKRCKGIKFMQKQVPEPQPAPKSPSFSKTPSHPQKSPSQKPSALQKQLQKLQLENKTLTQLLTSTIVILNKINKLVLNLIDEQNTHSTFSLSNDYNLALLSQELEDRINERINQLEMGEEEILERWGKIGAGKEKDDSVNTSVSNNRSGLLGNQLQFLVNCLPNETEKLHTKLNQLGFGIFQSVKQLSTLCEYRNVYKKEAFTYAIKEELLEGKNKQLETAINCMVKHVKANESPAVCNKILKELKELGIQFNNSMAKGKQNSMAGNRVKTQGDAASHPISKSTPIAVKAKGNKKIDEKMEFFDNCDDGQELFSPHQNNANNFNKLSERSLEKNKYGYSTSYGQTKTGELKESLGLKTKKSNASGQGVAQAETLGKSGRKLGGLILIEDL